jgi:hypothetical protein
VASTVSVFVNGNNLNVVADLIRRILIGSLDANLENPEERTFANDPQIGLGRGVPWRLMH